MKEVKVSEMQGAALDWAVGVAEGNPMETPGSDAVFSRYHGSYSPSTDWSQGGPLIERHNIWLGAPIMDRKRWDASVDVSIEHEVGETPLIAACRAIVAAKLGDVVSIPDELMEG